MSVLFFDSCDAYTTNPAYAARYAQTYGGISLTGGRFGGGWYNCGAQVDMPARARAFAGMAIRAQQTWVGDMQILAFMDGGTNQVSITQAMDGTVKAWRGSTQIGASAVGAFAWSATQWSSLQVDVVVDPAAGRVEVRREGNPTPILLVTGINTRNTSTSQVTRVLWGNSSNYNGLDDCWLFDALGSTNNALPGDIRGVVRRPSGVGATTSLTRVGGTSAGNYTAVNAAALDDDTSYVTGTSGRETYAMPASAIVGQVLARQVLDWSRKDDAGTANLAPVVRSGGTDYLGTARALLTTYAYPGAGAGVAATIWETDPATGAAWTTSAAPEIGVDVS